MADGGEPVICLGQQPCGFFPKRFLWAKLRAARRLQAEIGGRIVFFWHDADHDPRETLTILRDLQSGQEVHLNFAFRNKVQRRFSPLFAKCLVDDWKMQTARQLPKYVGPAHQAAFSEARGDNVSAFCLSVYRALGLLDGIEVVRSGDPAVRERACALEDFFVDVRWEDELVRARHFRGGHLRLHCGDERWVCLPKLDTPPAKTQISPTRDTRLRWMQSIIGCTHYVAGAEEMRYLDTREAPEITFLPRDSIDRPGDAYVEPN